MLQEDLQSNITQLAQNDHEIAQLTSNKAHVTPIVLSPLTRDVIRSHCPGSVDGRAILMVDAQVFETWGDILAELFEDAFECVEYCPVPYGEAAKGLESLNRLLELMCDLDVNRRGDSLFAIGGGTVLDVAGFAASIYRRGVGVTKIPTTLMAQVDAAVGLKNAINFSGRKNLVGSFSPPHSALIDTRFLTTLPQRHFANGVAEILKIAFVLDADLFKSVQGMPDKHLGDAAQTYIYSRAIQLMVRELNANPYEASLKRAVDFGHWLSPYIELKDAGLLHGEAVAIDIANSLCVSHARGLISTNMFEAGLLQISRFGLPIAHPLIGSQIVFEALHGTAQNRGGEQNIPLCTGVGRHAFFSDLTVEEVTAANGVLSQWHANLSLHNKSRNRLEQERVC